MARLGGFVARHPAVLLCGLSIGLFIAAGPPPASYWYYGVLFLVVGTGMPVVALTATAGLCAVTRDRDRWLRFARGRLRPAALAEALAALAALAALSALFLQWKGSLGGPAHPFRWDQRLMLVDRSIHGGHQPWELLWPIISIKPILRFVDGVYSIGWHFANAAFVAWAVWSRDRILGIRLLYSYVAAWVLMGTLAAAAFSSAGPVYYAHVVGGPSPYSGLMAFLTSEPRLLAPHAAAALWDGYLGKGPRLGISAMPSMHVAITMLMVLAGWRARPYWGVAATGLLLVMLFGSVALAWHYALDAYCGIVGMALIWWLTGLVLPRAGGERSAATMRASHAPSGARAPVGAEVIA